jgi:hypothetical protein
MQWLTNDMLRPLRRAFSLRPEEHGFEFALQGMGAAPIAGTVRCYLR